MLAYFLNPREINSRLAPWHLGLISTRLKAYPPILDYPTLSPPPRRSERGRNSMQAQTTVELQARGPFRLTTALLAGHGEDAVCI